MERRSTRDTHLTPPARRGRQRSPRPKGLSGQLGAALERRRVAKGWSSAQLAQAAGLGLGTVIRVEAGRVSPTLDTLFSLAHALDLSAAALVATCEAWTSTPKEPAR